MKTLVLGTRGSALALAQVELVKQALGRLDAPVEIAVKTITTSGDRSQREKMENAARESGAGLKGMFTREIETALLAGEIDAAVHSCKDLPGRLADGLEIAAVLERAATNDVLISKNAAGLDALPPGARLGTNSVRRRRQIEWARPDCIVHDLRGNVPTRLRKLRDEASLDAIVLAQAGLDRLGFSVKNNALTFESTTFHAAPLPWLPAIGQGAIALETRADDAETKSIFHAINHGPTFLRIRAERELLRLLDGDCNLPVGAGTQLDAGRLRMSAIIFREGGAPPLTGDAEGGAEAPEALAARLFQQLYGHQ